jgi:hypothetical protein
MECMNSAVILVAHGSENRPKLTALFQPYLDKGDLALITECLAGSTIGSDDACVTRDGMQIAVCVHTTYQSALAKATVLMEYSDLHLVASGKRHAWFSAMMQKSLAGRR